MLCWCCSLCLVRKVCTVLDDFLNVKGCYFEYPVIIFFIINVENNQHHFIRLYHSLQSVRTIQRSR